MSIQNFNHYPEPDYYQDPDYYLYDYNKRKYYFPHNNTYTTELKFNSKNPGRYLEHPGCHHVSHNTISISDETRSIRVVKKTILGCFPFRKNVEGHSITRNAIYAINKYIGYKTRLRMDEYIPKIDVICPHCELIITLNRFCTKCGSELIVYFQDDDTYHKTDINLGLILAIPPLNSWTPHIVDYRPPNQFNALNSWMRGELLVYKLPYNIDHPVWNKSSFYTYTDRNTVIY
jgi:hypothetical protein